MKTNVYCRRQFTNQFLGGAFTLVLSRSYWFKKKNWFQKMKLIGMMQKKYVQREKVAEVLKDILTDFLLKLKEWFRMWYGTSPITHNVCACVLILILQTYFIATAYTLIVWPSSIYLLQEWVVWICTAMMVKK